MKRSLFSSSLFGVAVATSIGACASPDVGVPCPVPPGASPAQMLAAKQSCYGGTVPKVVDTRLRKDVDILFVIDNSPSMSPKQKVLATAIPQFIQTIDATGANYQVGIVTTDLGYNPMPGLENKKPWNTIGACNTYVGDDGVLQNTPCTNRTDSNKLPLMGEAATACSSLCPDPRFVPANGARFISKVDGISNVPVKMVNGVDVGPQQAFQCMALVGDVGCGVEQQLESAKRALDNHRQDNAGFNRGSSVLAVIFITDEDDCSVDLMQRAFLDPSTPGVGTSACDINNPNAAINPACFNVDYRCIARDLGCKEALNTVGTKTNCAERQDSVLYSIDKYANFFASLPNPNLVIAGIWTPTLLDNLSGDPAKDGRLYVEKVQNQTDSAGLNRGVKTNAACYNPDPTLTTDTAKGFFGQAQVRLSTFIRRFKSTGTTENSICDANNYPKALQVIANNIINSFQVDCISPAPKTVNGNPECVVGYVDASNQKATPDTLLPVCSAKCCDYFATDPTPNAANDPNLSPNPHLVAEMAACSADPDCYCAVPSQVNCANGVVAGLWRKGNAPAPSGKVVNFQCAVAVAGP